VSYVALASGGETSYGITAAGDVTVAAPTSVPG
jgi:hypothetical protein